MPLLGAIGIYGAKTVGPYVAAYSAIRMKATFVALARVR